MAKKRGRKTTKKTSTKKKRATKRRTAKKSRKTKKTIAKRKSKKALKTTKFQSIEPMSDEQIVASQPIFGEKHPQCEEVAQFYSLPGQLSLVLHGVPFHLIKDQFVRFHAVHSTVIGWKFTIIYTVLLLSTIANAILFKNTYIDQIFWAIILVIGIHAIINLYLARSTREGKEVNIPIITKVARRISG